MMRVDLAPAAQAQWMVMDQLENWRDAMKRGFSCLLIASALAGSATAETMLGNFTVKSVFSEQGSLAGIRIQESNFSKCLFDLMYLNLNEEAGRAIFSLAITAKASSWKITRIDYTIGQNGSCTATGLHVE